MRPGDRAELQRSRSAVRAHNDLTLPASLFTRLVAVSANRADLEGIAARIDETAGSRLSMFGLRLSQEAGLMNLQCWFQGLVAVIREKPT